MPKRKAREFWIVEWQGFDGPGLHGYFNKNIFDSYEEAYIFLNRENSARYNATTTHVREVIKRKTKAAKKTKEPANEWDKEQRDFFINEIISKPAKRGKDECRI